MSDQQPIRLVTEPIHVETPNDTERLKVLVRTALDAGLRRGLQEGADWGYRAGALWGIREGYNLGIVEGATSSPGEVLEAFLDSPRARQRLGSRKTVKRNDAGQITEVIEEPA